MDHSPKNNLSRDYVCPCGKTYLSYPAIFTHIKLKHGGKVVFKLYKAPGIIEKPKDRCRPRGRPSLSIKTSEKEDSKETESKRENDIYFNSPAKKNSHNKYFENFR